ncbi:MAG: HAD family hydrolase [Lachnospiraceae bacterium]|nr:HAD family hydrolase [Lachnospiraceae bacterium]
MGYSTVIFDLDGTLLNTLEDLTDSVNYALCSMTYPERTIEEVRNFVGNGIKKLMERAVPEGTLESDVERALDYFKEYYAEHNQDKTKPYDGVVELMSKLRARGIKMAIVSNKIHSGVIALRDEFFRDIDVAIGDMPELNRKPAPDYCFLALRQLGSSVEEAVYVGDSDVDLETAKNVGLDCISVLWGFRDKDFLVEKGATVFADTPEDVERLVLL